MINRIISRTAIDRKATGRAYAASQKQALGLALICARETISVQGDGGMSRAAKGADCKSAGFAFVGSSPTSPTTAWGRRQDGLGSSDTGFPGGCSSMVEQQPSKLNTRVRFPSPAPSLSLNDFIFDQLLLARLSKRLSGLRPARFRLKQAGGRRIDFLRRRSAAF